MQLSRTQFAGKNLRWLKLTIQIVPYLILNKMYKIIKYKYKITFYSF